MATPITLFSPQTIPYHSLSILIVDDNREIRLCIREPLEAMGFFCQEAENGLQGLSVMQTHSVDILVTDLNMPEMDGMQLTRCLRQERGQGGPFIVMMSAGLTDDLKVQAFQSGANVLLDKPFSLSDLLVAIQSPHDHLPQAA